MTIYLFSKPCVVLSSLESFEEAMLGRNDFAFKGLQEKYGSQVINPHGKGIFYREFGREQTRVRNTAISALRSIGVGKCQMETAISEEISEMISKIQADTGFDPTTLVHSAVANITLRILLDERMDYDDPTFQELQNKVRVNLQEIMWLVTVNNLPFARHFEPVKSGFDRWVRANREVLTHVTEKVTDLMTAESVDGNFVSRFVRTLYGDSGRKDASNIDTEEVCHVVNDLFNGGFETTSTSIRWTLVYLANNQHVQQKLHDEIARVVGTETPVTLAHKRDLHYLQAVVWEVQRCCCLLPIMPRMSDPNKETRLFKYLIPKATTVFLNIHSVHMNEKKWGDPRVFRPERFLDDKGQFVKSKHVIPFSMGKRSCTGEVLAKQELYFFTALIFQRLQILPGRDVRIDEEPMVGGTLCPKPFTIKAVERR